MSDTYNRNRDMVSHFSFYIFKNGNSENGTVNSALILHSTDQMTERSGHVQVNQHVVASTVKKE